MKSSDISGFYKLPIKKRVNIVKNFAQLTDDEVKLLEHNSALSLETADIMIENVIGVTQLPVGVATHFRINKTDYLIPMAIEETSVVAAASHAAKLAREGYASVIEKIRGELPPGKAVEFLKLFHALPVWEYLWFQNVRIIKNPLDLWVMQQIIYEERPDFIIETGTMEGGSALYWAHTLSGMGLDGSRVITVDLHNFTQGASSHFLWKKHVLFFQGSSTDPAIVSAIARMTANKRVIVTLDSDHSRQHVLNELRAYSPMINRGSYLVVEDTHMDGVPTMPTTGPGPHAAVEQFLKEGGSQNFERDLNRESMIMTFNPGGWLRRK